MTTDGSLVEEYVLLEDGALVLTVDRGVSAVVRPWLPRAPVETRPGREASVRVHVSGDSAPGHEPPGGRSALQILGVRGWLDRGKEVALLASTDGTLTGTVHIARARAEIHLDTRGDADAVALHAICGLTISAGLLLGRDGQVLLHAGCFVAPDGGAWLLVGDSETGKSSTVANLIRAGWDYLADDQVVVRDAPCGFEVEGWPRSFNLDDGFHDGRSTGKRSPVRADELGSGTWRRSAPLAGMLFPRLDPDAPSRLEEIGAAEALAALIRQSPWLLADLRTAEGLLPRLAAMARLPIRRLRLGYDCYRDPDRLASLLRTGLPKRGEVQENGTRRCEG